MFLMLLETLFEEDFPWEDVIVIHKNLLTDVKIF